MFRDNIFAEKNQCGKKCGLSSIELIKVDEYRFGTVTVKSEI